jgi:hypothetical protein
VQRELWQQQALAMHAAEAAAMRKQQKGAPVMQPSKRAAVAAALKGKPVSRAAAAVAAAGKAPARRVHVSLNAVLDGSLDFRTAFMGMEGTPFVIALLASLLRKLRMKLALQVREACPSAWWVSISSGCARTTAAAWQASLSSLGLTSIGHMPDVHAE